MDDFKRSRAFSESSTVAAPFAVTGTANLTLLRAVIEASMDGVVIADVAGRILAVNPAAETMFGWAEAQVVGRDLRDVIFSDAHRDAHREEMDRLHPSAVTSQIGARIQVEARRANGDVFPAELAITEVKVDDTVYVAAYLRDTTQKNEAEAKLKTAKDEAEAANRAKSDFLATMSHEIRTPLNGVLGLLGLMSETALDAAQTEYVTRAQSSAETLLTLISDILDLSKIEAGKLELEDVAFDPVDLVHEALTLVQISAARKGVALVVEADTPTPRVVGDQAHVRQVLVNLVANAVKFTDDGTVTVHVAFDGGMLRYAVNDTGIGVALGELDTLFEPFTQADPSLQRRHGGTGLGLAICRELVAQMSGELGVDSEPGAGSRFWFHIPVSCDTRADDVAPIESEPLEPVTLGGRILLAEDSQTNALVASTVLRSHGARVDIVANGLEAVEAAQAHAYDLILMDVSMPEMDGFAATRRIRDLGGWAARVPIVAMTAHALRGDRQKCLRAGMTGYLTKPIRRVQLVRSAQDWLSARTPQPISAPETPALDDAHIAREWADDLDQFECVAGMFLHEMADLRTRMHAYVSASQNVDAARMAHTLKSAAANVGAFTLSAAARDVEAAVERDADHNLDPLLAVLDAAADHTVKDIERRLGDSL